MSINNQFTPAPPRSIIRKEYFEGTVIKGAKVGRTFKFKHILITNGQYIQPDYNCFGDKDIIDITHVTSYPEGYIALIDASEGLPEDLYWYLDYRAQLLLRIVNEHRDHYKDIENCAAYRDLITVICFMNKYSKKFKDSKGFYRILIRTYANATPDKFVITCVNYWDVNKHGPKPIPILENTRYKDYSGAFDFDASKIYNNNNVNEIKNVCTTDTAEVKDFDPATLYPTRFNPVNVDEMINNMLEQTYNVDKLLTNNCWKSALTFMICTFNAYIDAGKSLQEVWELPIGKYLRRFINNLFENGTNSKADIGFSIRVGDDCKLILGEYEDADPSSKRGEVLTKTGDIVRITNCDDTHDTEKDNNSAAEKPADDTIKQIKSDLNHEATRVLSASSMADTYLSSIDKDIAFAQSLKAIFADTDKGPISSSELITDMLTYIDGSTVKNCLSIVKLFVDILNCYSSLTAAWLSKWGGLFKNFLCKLEASNGSDVTEDIKFAIVVNNNGKLVVCDYNDPEMVCDIDEHDGHVPESAAFLSEYEDYYRVSIKRKRTDVKS